MAFWSKNFADKPLLNDPKRKFRFKVTFNGIKSDGGVLWYAKTATKPSFQIASTEHKYLNHTFYYPGAVTWQDVTITLVDPTNPDMAASLAGIIEAGGYRPPAKPDDYTTMTKASAVSSLGTVTVTQIDHEGKELETWTLWNAFITELKFGDLEYGADDLTELSVTMKYDWAQLETPNTNGADLVDGNSASGDKSFFATNG